LPLEHVQLLESLLYQLLDAAAIVDILVLTESISGAPFGVLAEIVGGELVALTEELAVLWGGGFSEIISIFSFSFHFLKLSRRLLSGGTGQQSTCCSARQSTRGGGFSETYQRQDFLRRLAPRGD